MRENQEALAKRNQITFTARLANQMSLRRGRGHACVTFPELVFELQRISHADRMPRLKLLLSVTTVRVPSFGQVLPTKISRKRPIKTIFVIKGSENEQIRGVFTVHLPSDPEEDEGRKFMDG